MANFQDRVLSVTESRSITAAGTDTYTATLSPAITAYALYQTFNVLFTNANTGASTINFNGLGAIAIQKNGSVALASGDILAGQVYSMMYDGTDFQLLGMISAGGGGSSTWSHEFWTYNMLGAANYTWNAVTVGGATPVLLLERHRFLAFTGSGMSEEGAFVNTMLPSDYVAGSDIKITANLITNATGGAVYYMGLTQPTAGNVLTGAAETEWVTNTLVGVAGYTVIPTVFTFDGTNLLPGDSIAIMIYRDPGAAGDTINADTYLSLFTIEQV